MHITIRDSDTTVQLDVCNEYFVKELILKVNSFVAFQSQCHGGAVFVCQ